MKDTTSQETTKTFETTLEFLHDVPLTVSAELGRVQLTVRNLIGLQVGSIIELTREATEPTDIRVNGKLVARGEVVVVNDQYGVRVTEVLA